MLMHRLAPPILTVQTRFPTKVQDNLEVCMKTIAVALTLATLGISMTQATQASSTGRITFSGAIVEDACRINQQDKQMQVTCLSGAKQATEDLNLQQLATQSPQRLATSQVSYRWIDQHHTKAVITINQD
jgi:type 1 fimbria pilin